VAQKLRAIGIIDGPGTTDEAAIAYAENFGSRNLFMVDPGVKYWDTGTSSTVDAPGSAWAAGLFAWTDAEYGFWASPSNKELTGITGTGRAVEYLDGDETCRANLLNNANITTIIRDDGYRLWGNRTLSSDPKWAYPRSHAVHPHGCGAGGAQVGGRPFDHQDLRDRCHQRSGCVHA
jgi:phage tail sheath protein FI